ncbi:MAG: glycosyl hydrolase family 18 protein [Pseudomonadota bacterium]
MLSYHAANQKRRHYFPVLCYHGCVLNEADKNTYWEYFEDFKAQIANLKRLGYVFVLPSVYLQWYNGTYNPPKPIACVHIDDGLSILTPMADYLVAQNIPFGLALISRRQRKRLPEDGFIDWASIHAYIQSGYAEVLCHTYNMHSLALRYDADVGAVVSAPVLEGPCWVDNGLALHVVSGDTRYAWDYSHTDDCWGLPIWGVDPFDGTTKINTTITFTPASSFDLHLIRLMTSLTVPGGTGYAVQIEVFLNGNSCGTVTFSPKLYGTRSQWPEREFITLNLPTPRTVNASVPNTLTFETKNTGAFMMRVYFKPDASSLTSANTNCQSLSSGVSGAQYIDRPASYDWLGNPLMILGDGTGATVSDGTFTSYVQADLDVFQDSVQSWLNATWSFFGNPQDLGNEDKPCFGTLSGVALTNIYEVLVTAGQVDIIQLHLTAIFGESYSATIKLSVATTPAGTYTEVYRGSAKWTQFGNAEFDVIPFNTSGTIMYLKVETLDVCPTVWGTDNYSRIVFDAFNDKGGNPQILGDSDTQFIGTASSTALTTIHQVNTTAGLTVDCVQVHLTADLGSDYAGNVKISVGATNTGPWTEIFNGAIQWVESDTTNYHTSFFTTTGTATFFKFETLTTSGTNNYSRIVRDSDTGLPWIKIGLFEKAWIKFGKATTASSTTPTQFIYPFGSSYDATAGTFLIPDLTLNDIAPPLKTALTDGGCNCGFNIVPRRANRATELREPDSRHTQWALGREIIYGTASNSTTMQHNQLYAGMEWPDAQHGGVIWSTALEPDPAGNATIRYAVNVLDEVHFDAWFCDAAGHIIKAELNDGGTYLSLNGDSQLGEFVLGETLTGGTSGAAATLIFYENLMHVSMLSGTFVPLETLTGGTSGATIALDELGAIVYANDKAFLQAAGVECYLIFNNLPDGEPDVAIATYVVNHPDVYIPLMVAATVDNGWDGMMFDIEAIPEADRVASTTFIIQLYSALQAVSKKLCIAVPLRTGTSYDDGSEDWWGWCDHAVLIQHCDSFLVMSYLESGPGTLPAAHCSNTVFNDCYAYLKSVCNSAYWSRIRVGCNAYGHYWTDKTNEATAEYTGYHEGYWNALYGAVAVSVSDTEAHFQDSFNGEGWFATPQTIQRAVDKASSEKLGGVFIWKADDADIYEFFPKFRSAPAIVPTIPEGIVPSITDGYSFQGPEGVSRVEVGGGINRYSLDYHTSYIRVQIALALKTSRLLSWSNFYYGEIQRGALPFKLPLDSGFGADLHTLYLDNDTYSFERRSNALTLVTFEGLTKSQIFDLTLDEAKAIVDAYNGYTATGLDRYKAPRDMVLSMTPTGYSGHGAPGVINNAISGANPSRALAFARTVQTFSGGMVLTPEQLIVWLAFFFIELNKGTFTFKALADSGSGVTLHSFNAIPGSHKVEFQGNTRIVSLQLEGEASYYD